MYFFLNPNNGFAFKTVTFSFVAKQSFVLSIEICVALIFRFFFTLTLSNTPDDPCENQDPVTFDMAVRNMQSFYSKNKLEKLVYLIGFITRRPSNSCANFPRVHITLQMHNYFSGECYVHVQTCVGPTQCVYVYELCTRAARKVSSHFFNTLRTGDADLRF